jgi:regulator of protease activity HflC (stomatin/prohibitin superfamily)
MTFVFAAFLFLVVVALIVLAMTAFVVQQQTVAIVQRFGKFARLGGPGLNIKIPLIETVADRVNLRVQLLPVIVETKTKDNVFVHITVSVQYAVIGDRVYDAYYKLQKPIDQITAFVFDVIRAHVPSLDLDEVFLRKDEIANAVRDLLTKEMAEFGYGISTALVTEIEPDKRVKDSMNEINANQRLLEAAKAKGEANKVLVIKQAEAEAESKALQGEGIARERVAIAKGLLESAQILNSQLRGAQPEEAMVVLVLTQYLDTLKSIGAQSNTIMLPHSPGALSDLMGQIRAAIVAGGETAIVAGNNKPTT